MVTQYDFVAGAEEKESTGAIRALRLALFQALVADERSLLVTSNTRDLHALESSACKLSVNF